MKKARVVEMLATAEKDLQRYNYSPQSQPLPQQQSKPAREQAESATHRELAAEKLNNNRLKQDVNYLQADLTGNIEKLRQRTQEVEQLKGALESAKVEKQLEIGALKVEHESLNAYVSLLRHDLASAERDRKRVEEVHRTTTQHLRIELANKHEELKKCVQGKASSVVIDSNGGNQGEIDALKKKLGMQEVSIRAQKINNDELLAEKLRLKEEQETQTNEIRTLQGDLSKQLVDLQAAKYQLDKFGIENEQLKSALATLQGKWAEKATEKMKEETSKQASSALAIQQLSGEVKQVKKKLGELCVKNKTLTQEVGDWECKLAKQESTSKGIITALESDKTRLQNEVNILKVVKVEQSDKIARLQAENGTLGATIQRHEQRVCELTLENEQTKGELGRHMDVVGKLRVEQEKLQREVDKVGKEKGALKGNIAELEGKLGEEKCRMKKVISEQSGKNQELNQEVDELKQKNQVQEYTVSSQQGEITALKGNNNSLCAKITELEATKRELSDKIQALHLKNGEQELKIQQQVQRLQELTLEIGTTKEALVEAEEVKGRHKQEMNNLKVEHLKLVNENAESAKKLYVQSGLISTLRERLESLQHMEKTESEKLKELADNVQEKLASEVHLTEELRKQISALETKLKQEMDEWQQKNQTHESTNSNLQGEILALKTENVILKARVDKLAATKRQQLGTIETLQLKVEDLETVIKQHMHNILELKQKNHNKDLIRQPRQTGNTAGGELVDNPQEARFWIRKIREKWDNDADMAEREKHELNLALSQLNNELRVMGEQKQKLLAARTNLVTEIAEVRADLEKYDNDLCCVLNFLASSKSLASALQTNFGAAYRKVDRMISENSAYTPVKSEPVQIKVPVFWNGADSTHMNVLKVLNDRGALYQPVIEFHQLNTSQPNGGSGVAVLIFQETTDQASINQDKYLEANLQELGYKQVLKLAQLDDNDSRTPRKDSDYQLKRTDGEILLSLNKNTLESFLGNVKNVFL